MIFYLVSQEEISTFLTIDNASSWLSKFLKRHPDELSPPEDPQEILSGFSEGAWYSAFFLDDFLKDFAVNVGDCPPNFDFYKRVFDDFLRNFQINFPQSYTYITGGIPGIFPASVMSFGSVSLNNLDLFMELLPEEIFEGIPDIEESFYQEVRFAAIEAKKHKKDLVISHLDYLSVVSV